ncbi:MAG: hypothetical protein EBR05_12335, partial [Marivivens sp.]|nr:hypothetical protein [Marivivens sp.]
KKDMKRQFKSFEEIIEEIINEMLFSVYIAWALFIGPVGNAVEKAVRWCARLLRDSILWGLCFFVVAVGLMMALPIFIFRVIFRVLWALYR